MLSNVCCCFLFQFENLVESDEVGHLSFVSIALLITSFTVTLTHFRGNADFSRSLISYQSSA